MIINICLQSKHTISKVLHIITIPTFLTKEISISSDHAYRLKVSVPKHTLSLYCKLHQHLEHLVYCLELSKDCVVCWHFARNWSNNTLTCKQEITVMNFYTAVINSLTLICTIFYLFNISSILSSKEVLSWVNLVQFMSYTYPHKVP
jgi:hypothetical protein